MSQKEVAPLLPQTIGPPLQKNVGV